MTDDLERRLREDAKAGVGAGSDWSAEECATYWARQCSTARRNAAEAANEIARLRAENEALREAAQKLVEFGNFPAEAKRPDVFSLRMAALADALQGRIAP